MKLKVSIGQIEFQNPVTVASGTFGYVAPYVKASDLCRLGAFIPKTITLAAREGNPSPRIVETAAGMINAIGIENDGLNHFLEHKLPDLAQLKIPLIVSVSAYQHNDFEALVARLSQEKSVSLIELNLSCPNLKHTRLIAQDPAATYEVVAALKKISTKPLIAKLSPNVTDIAAVACAAQEAGADAISLVNTFSAMAVDVHKRRPILGNITGGLSGPAIKPIALKMVYDVKKRVTIPIVAMGGIMTTEDALEFLIVGATMVAVGTANFVDPQTPLKILQGIKAYMKQHHLSDIHDVIGSLQVP